MKAPFVRADLGRRMEGLPGFELVNLYPAGAREIEAMGRGPGFVQRAGTRLWTDRSGVGLNRGLFQFPGAASSRLYGVTGTTLEDISSTGAPTALGTISGTDPVFWDMVRGILLINADGKVWSTTGGAPTQLTDPDLGTISAIAAIDGRLLAVRAESDTFVYSDVLSPGTIDTLSFTTAEAFGDVLRRILVWQRNLYMVGARSTEIFGATGDSNNPFARIGGAVEPVGTPAKYSPAMLGPQLFMVAVGQQDDSPFVVALTPGLSVISDHRTESMLCALTPDNLARVRGFAWRQRRASFYALAFPDGAVRVCHLDSGVWFDAAKGDGANWLAACYAMAYGKHLVAGPTSGAIYELAEDCYDDAEEPMRRVATAYLAAERPTPLETLVVDALATEGPGPYEATVELSRDDGRNWTRKRRVRIDGAGHRAPLSFGWGAIRRPGAIARVTVEASCRVGLFNVIANEAAT